MANQGRKNEAILSIDRRLFFSSYTSLTVSRGFFHIFLSLVKRRLGSF